MIAKVGDHASRQELAQHCCDRRNGIAATAFEKPSAEAELTIDPRGRIGGQLLRHVPPPPDRVGRRTQSRDEPGGRRENAFGKPTILSATNTQLSTSAVGNRFLFTGREWIAELGLYDYRHRLYHPGLGRFLQGDPLGLQTEGEKLSADQAAYFWAGGAPESFGATEMNLYRYCGDDPVDGSDPWGLEVDRQPAKRVPVVIDKHGIKRPGLFGKTSTDFQANVQLKEVKRGVFKLDPSKSKLTIKTQIATEHNGQGRSERAIRATETLHEPRHGDAYDTWHSKNIGRYSSATFTDVDAAHAAAAVLGKSLISSINALEARENTHEPRAVWAPIERQER